MGPFGLAGGRIPEGEGVRPPLPQSAPVHNLIALKTYLIFAKILPKLFSANSFLNSKVLYKVFSSVAQQIKFFSEVANSFYSLILVATKSHVNCIKVFIYFSQAKISRTNLFLPSVALQLKSFLSCKNFFPTSRL